MLAQQEPVDRDEFFAGVVDPPVQPRKFTMVLRLNGEVAEAFNTDTQMDDESVRSLVRSWQRGHRFSDLRAQLLVERLIQCRDARRG